MTTNKKLFLIFLVSVIIPIILSFLFNCFIKGIYFFEYKCSSVSFVLLSSIPLIGSIYTIYLNHKTGYKSKIWYIISSLMILVLIIIILSLYSLSNFGF